MQKTAGGGNGKEAVGKPSECGTSRNADKKRKRKSEGGSSESYEAGNGSELSNASEEELEEVDPYLLYYPLPEFSDFAKDRAENCFAANQVWAIYDSCNIMPRKYVRIKKVYSHRFKIQFTWLLPDPDEESEKNWFGVDLCLLLVEEHQPPYQYEYVDVLTGFKENVGIGVAYLGKVEGFVSVFQRIAQNGVLLFNIAPGELYRFSHRIPSFRMIGKERVGVPEGSFELDPASLPINDRI
ncbi:hypothetical protein QYF36_005141 [Acer negundo]|nr:hypothetical protein QYF36_005141 [Acer negundo]